MDLHSPCGSHRSLIPRLDRAGASTSRIGQRGLIVSCGSIPHIGGAADFHSPVAKTVTTALRSRPALRSVAARPDARTVGSSSRTDQKFKRTAPRVRGCILSFSFSASSVRPRRVERFRPARRSLERYCQFGSARRVRRRLPQDRAGRNSSSPSSPGRERRYRSCTAEASPGTAS